MNDRERELLICQKTQNEGFGAVYERIMLGRLLKRLAQKYGIRSVLEYGCSITKGYDNLALMSQCEVTVANENAPPPEGRFDLVWNFALTQQEPRLLEKMKQHSKRYILVFTPNLLNIGTPIHLMLHVLSRTKCQHAERGRIALRTPWGLKNFFAKQGLKVLEAGIIDIPPWPDTAFSIKDVKRMLGFKIRENEPWFSQDPEIILAKIEKMSFLEKSSLPYLLKLFFAHHLFVLGEIK